MSIKKDPIVKSKEDNKTNNKTKVKTFCVIFMVQKNITKATDVLRRIYVMVLRLFYYDYRIYVNRESTMSHNLPCVLRAFRNFFLPLYVLRMVLLVLLKTMEIDIRLLIFCDGRF